MKTAWVLNSYWRATETGRPKGAKLVRKKEIRLQRALNETCKLSEKKNTCTQQILIWLKVGKAFPKDDQGLMLGHVWQCWLLTVGRCNIHGCVLGIQTGPVCTPPLFLLIDPHVLFQTSLFFKESVRKCLLQRMDFVFCGHEYTLRSPWKLVLWGTPDCVLPVSKCLHGLQTPPRIYQKWPCKYRQQGKSTTCMSWVYWHSWRCLKRWRWSC